MKKCVIKGDNWSVKGPTKNLYILNAEVVLMTVNGKLMVNGPQNPINNGKLMVNGSRNSINNG